MIGESSDTFVTIYGCQVTLFPILDRWSQVAFVVTAFAAEETSRHSTYLFFLYHYFCFYMIPDFSPFYHEVYISALQDWCPPSSYLSDFRPSIGKDLTSDKY